MSTTWKWIIGIIVGLLVLTVIAVGVGMMVRHNLVWARPEVQLDRDFNERNLNDLPFNRMRMPGMMGFGMMPFRMMPFGGMFGALIPLGLLALVVLGIISLVRALRSPSRAGAVAAQSAPLEAASVENPAPEVPACKRCGKPLSSDWKVCPHCGKKI
jgi:hypothetical protein